MTIIIVLIIIIFASVGIYFCVDFFRIVPLAERRKEKKVISRFKQDVENELSLSEMISRPDNWWYTNTWNSIYQMKPGKYRDRWKQDFLNTLDVCRTGITKGNCAAYFDLPIYKKTELLSFLVKEVNCPQCGTLMHIAYQAFYASEASPCGLGSLYPVNEKEKNMIFTNWLKKDRSSLPEGFHLDNCPGCETLYPLEEELFTDEHRISVLRFLQEFSLTFSDGKQISFSEHTPIPMLTRREQEIYQAMLHKIVILQGSDKAKRSAVLENIVAAFRTQATVFRLPSAIDCIETYLEAVKQTYPLDNVLPDDSYDTVRDIQTAWFSVYSYPTEVLIVWDDMRDFTTPEDFYDVLDHYIYAKAVLMKKYNFQCYFIGSGNLNLESYIQETCTVSDPVLGSFRRSEFLELVRIFDDADFLRSCDIACNTTDAEVALTLRRELADNVSRWIQKISPEDITPDMTCGKLVDGWSPEMYWHEGVDSVGFESIRRMTIGHPLPEKVFEELIQPEKCPKITMKEFFRNYLDVWKKHHPANPKGTDK